LTLAKGGCKALSIHLWNVVRDALSASLGRRCFVPVHGWGAVLVDVAVLLADGGEAVANIDVPGNRGKVLAPGRHGSDGVAGAGGAGPCDAGTSPSRPLCGR